ncbi:MAG: deoxyuridine 5'-triphosphate nucleotidohydrolase [Candidatus Margulisiibacteriota bacterium]
MLNHNEIEILITEKQLIEGYIDLEKQLTPNGFDMTVAMIYKFCGQGYVDFSNKERKMPECNEIAPVKANIADKHGWWDLPKGAYKVITNETVNMPGNMTALAFTRTTLLRMGAFTQNGVWDAGFSGKSEFILVVENPSGIRIKQNARVVQLVFESIKDAKKLYNGIFQNKGL